jgi:hypothetical protein
MSKNQRDVSHIDEGEINKPVAWMTENGTIFDELPPISGGLIPLYTHPIRELSMSEIDKHFNQFWYQDDNGVHFDHYGFATSLIKASRGEE